MMIVVQRPPGHPKGEKTIARWRYGMPVPAGIIIGKGTLIKLESEDGHQIAIEETS